MECLAIIPARGGSKGIPRKNIRPLAGKPLIAYNIEQASLSRYVNRLVVSTDDPEIAAISKEYGAEVVWRPVEISGDTASSESALLHTLEFLSQEEGYTPDLLVFMQCTSPLTLAEDIDGTIQALLDDQADTALAVIPFHYFLWRRPTAEADGSGAMGINHDKRFRPLRQERPPQFLETGAVYVMRMPGFLDARHRFYGKTAMYVMPAERRLEIDDPIDFQVAEVLLQVQQAAHKLPVQKPRMQKLHLLPNPVSALVLDFDGVFTDNRVIVFQDGREAVVCDRGDGWGIGQLKKFGLPILILSTESNPVVQARANKLGIPCVQGLQDKWGALQVWLKEHDLDPQQVVYLGNDINDLECMTHVGFAVAVADAHPSILPSARLVLEHPGGKGAIREICDLIKDQLCQ
jgi:YrbI family 3-deoxy-D-manno-octulosonate 8-phosphate phosphatase